MTLYCIGLNHETAPVEIREKFSVPAPKQGLLSKELAALGGVKEAVVLSTCNRTEFYLAAENIDLADNCIKKHIIGENNPAEKLDNYFYKKIASDAIRHLCNVVSGINSMVLGETEIFGQVKEAYRQAHGECATGRMLNKLFQKSFSVGKKVRNQSSIQIGQTSIGSVAVDLAEKIFGDLKNSQVMVIGAGEMSRTTAQSLKSRGAKSIIVANRSHLRAVELAKELDGEAVKFDQWEEVMCKVDIVISSTGASHAVVEPQHIEAVRKLRKFRPIFFIDIAVPRDINPLVGDIEEVYLYDIDTLKQLADEGVNKRLEQVTFCQKIIEEEIKNIELS